MEENQEQNLSLSNYNPNNVDEIETTTAAAATKQESENPTTATAAVTTTTTKRQRRPSVRLGDIDSNPRRIKQPQQQLWSYDNLASKETTNLPGTKTLKSRPSHFSNPILKSCSSSGIGFGDDEKGKFDALGGGWKVLEGPKLNNVKPSKRVKTNWILNNDNNNNNNNNNNNGGTGGGDDEFSRDFNLESFESDLREHDSPDGGGLVKSSRDQLEDDAAMSGRYHRGIVSDRKRGKGSVRNVENGVQGRRYGNLDVDVRIWLDGLRLGRYGPVFEIHEVDYEVLPLLTLEDLKDMGINSVGSRRKLYCAIQKLGHVFS